MLSETAAAMRNAIAAVLSARSALLKRQSPAPQPPPGSPTTTSTGEAAATSLSTTSSAVFGTTSSAVLATTSVDVAITTVTDFNGVSNTSFSLATVTYTPLVVSVTVSSTGATVTIPIGTSTGSNRDFTNTIFAPASFVYTPSVTISTAGVLDATSSTPPAISSNIVTTGTGTGQSATSSSLSGTASHTSGPSNGALSHGAVAGIAVGCAIIGALLAVGVLWFIMKDSLKKKKEHPTTAPSRQSGYSGSNQPGYLSAGSLRPSQNDREKSRAVERSVEEATVEPVLEQPKDDGTVKQTVAALFKAVEDHSENYFVDTASRSGRSVREFTTGARPLPTGVATQNDVKFESLLADRLSRSSAITSLITAQILDALDFFGVTEKSLLPQMVTTFLRSSTTQIKDNHSKSYSGSLKLSTDSLTGSRLLLSRWRTSTASLLTPDDTSLKNVHAQKAVDELMDGIDAIVGPYVRPETDKDRRQHLAKICKRAQELGLMLLSQPADWSFHWSDAANAQKHGPQTNGTENSKKPVFVVQPQLRRVTDNVARKLDRPLIVLDSQVLR